MEILGNEAIKYMHDRAGCVLTDTDRRGKLEAISSGYTGYTSYIPIIVMPHNPIPGK